MPGVPSPSAEPPCPRDALPSIQHLREVGRRANAVERIILFRKYWEALLDECDFLERERAAWEAHGQKETFAREKAERRLERGEPKA